MPRKTVSVKRKPVKKNRQNSRPVHKRVLLSPFFVFILVCAGVFLSLWTYHASAVDIKVSARVAGVAPTDPAVITAPSENDRFSAIPISVSGTCPLLSYVTIYSNGAAKGSALCSGTGEFSLSVSLFPDQNELTAHVYNLADEEGPESDTLNVFYDVPPPPPETPDSGNSGQSPQSEPSSPSETAEPFVISTEFKVRAFYAGDKVEWPVNISGGKAPYAINVEWGDGANTVYSRSEGGNFNISHQYSSSGPDQGSFTVKISASDSESNTSFLEFFIFIAQKEQLVTNSGGAGSIFTKSSGGISGVVETIAGNKFLAAAWPSFGVVSLMAFSFWLGEKESFWIIRKGPRIR